ncbi:MAG: hypothetical protein KYX69_08850 [Sphingomonas sp.]|uniref:hypothetical protein n=1 Tax=Sphingomonas sp. TaxID=28214 RepID=UPI00261649B5|nr:hypothetical protein [Sphingomonas sp.]MDK2767813.1 hypothetical protein [Sphingomonas sp.]
MTPPIDETPYCRLYIDTRASDDDVQALLDQSTSKEFDGLRVWADNFKNDAYLAEQSARKPYHPIEASRWTAEVDAEDSDPESHERFQAGVVAMIRSLRACGMIVTASCDFEDRVASETGWNWSSETTEPPRS